MYQQIVELLKDYFGALNETEAAMAKLDNDEVGKHANLTCLQSLSTNLLLSNVGQMDFPWLSLVQNLASTCNVFACLPPPVPDKDKPDRDLYNNGSYSRYGSHCLS